MQGQCFPWSEEHLLDNPHATLCHGVVTQPCQLTPEPYVHAWIEEEIDGIETCLDWQTMEAGHGGRYRGKGYPKVIFYALFHPERVVTYTAKEALQKLIDEGCHGPWGEDFYDVIFAQLQRQKERQAS